MMERGKAYLDDGQAISDLFAKGILAVVAHW